LSLDIAARGERLTGLNNIEIFGVDVVMLWEVVILFRDEYSLTKEILVNLLSVSLWDEPIIRSVVGFRWLSILSGNTHIMATSCGKVEVDCGLIIESLKLQLIQKVMVGYRALTSFFMA
jgi:hypothetical protein